VTVAAPGGQPILMSFPDSFTTERLRAERLRDSDLPELRRMHRDGLVMAELGGLRDEAQTRDYLIENLRHWDEHQFGLWIVYELEGAVPVGRALLRHLMVGGTEEVETGYALYEPFWGRGLASEILRSCLAHGFTDLGLPSIVAVTSPSNFASQHVLRKGGLACERTFEHHGAAALLFRINRSEFQSGRPE